MEYPKTRKEAQQQGATHYFTGVPCKHGHIALRLVKGSCVECRKLEWTESNERRKEYFKTSEAAKAAKRRYYERNKELVAARAKLRPVEDRRKHRAAYKKANPELYRVLVNTRRRRNRQATPKWVSAEERAQIRALYAEAQRLTKTLGIPYEVDHVYPLISDQVCGLHLLANLQIIPKAENLKKSNQLIDSPSAT
jgi:hypothetical protein